MRRSRPPCPAPPARLLPVLLLPLFASLALPATAAAQRTVEDSYLIGEPRRLEMVVHVFGQVTRPGEYRVPDDTDVLELISKAGGPTDLANLGNVTIRRRDEAGPGAGRERVLRVDLSEFLSEENAPPPPPLRPGDVVTVPRNKMARWRTAFAMVRDVSVVVTAYLLYLRVDQNR